MRKRALLTAVAAMAVAWLGVGAPAALAQATSPDAIDPTLPLAFTEAVNNHDSDAVLQHFVEGGTVVFENSLFGIPSQRIPAAEYAARQRPNQPDVPTDIRLEIVDKSVQIDHARASWTWRETAGFLKDINVDYIEFDVVVSASNHRFETLVLSPTQASLAKLISLAPTKESLARLPYSPAVPTIPFSADGSIGPAPVVVRFEPSSGMKVKGAAVLFGKEDGTSVSLHVTGLTADAPAQATLHAGGCATPGASFAELPDLSVDASGTGTATGPVLFRGAEGVEMSAIADGDHVISISQSESVVACAKVPTMEGLPDSAPGMPRTGGPGGQVALLLLAVMSVALALAGLRLRRART